MNITEVERAGNLDFCTLDKLQTKYQVILYAKLATIMRKYRLHREYFAEYIDIPFLYSGI